VRFFFATPAEVFSAGKGTLRARDQQFSYGTVINAAGLQADLVAKQFGAGERYVILPFKGLYYRLADDAAIPIHRLIYPVPDLSVPFLGVHFTRSISGHVYLGPTAIPALGRENYRGLSGMSVMESLRIAGTLARQYATNHQGFRRFVHAEARRFAKPFFVAAARALVPAIRTEHLVSCDKVGIRAQLFDREKRELVMDFVVEEGERSLHILNAVSPGFTSAFTFARHVVDGWRAEG
ncbi:MAG TPA: FAD-dependent oxidoreductase, partial [Thermoanaerobaculia bacterium]|nr:FAD-dependent oxidoreductase [Thermoanaerobaculia bacterium]